MLPGKSYRFFPSLRLGDHGHILAGIDNRPDTHSHERMVVDHHHANSLRIAHMVISDAAEATALLGISTVISVPLPIVLSRINLP